MLLSLRKKLILIRVALCVELNEGIHKLDNSKMPVNAMS